MKAPLNWIKDYVDINVGVKEYADRMTMSGSKVEGYEKIYDGMINVIVGRVTEIIKHVNADKLMVCRVETGNGTITVVTGAKNVKSGDLVPVALDGAMLPDGEEIRRGSIRGVVSEGMFCSLKELGLTAADYPEACGDGIFILSNDCIMGQDIRDALDLRDDVVEFEITPNRSDCLSIRGLALESAVTLNEGYRPPVTELIEEGRSAEDYICVEIKDSDLCPAYIARVCTDVSIMPSPAWMRKRLRNAGIRPINNVVDITNYVMLEYGQPMHAFDIEYIHGRKITVRRAFCNETIRTLDQVDRYLDTDDLVIADDEKVIALAGIMGGANSEIKDSTYTVVFESANFEPSHIRITSKKVGLRTESSMRFEKGLDPMNTVLAADRACQLMEAIGAGKVCKRRIGSEPRFDVKKRIAFRPDKINSILGTHISREQMAKTLSALRFEINEMTVVPPSFRMDINIEEDVAEEVARFFDYNSIKPTLPQSTVSGAGQRTRIQKIRKLVRDHLTSFGYYEACTYSFNSPKIYAKLNMKDEKAVRIKNPLGEDFSVMRTTTYDGILRSLSINFNRRVKAASLFELSKIYIPTEEDRLPSELEKITLGAYGDYGFYDLKGAFEGLADQLGIRDMEYVTHSNDTTFHPGRCAKIFIAGEECGIIGQIHPIVSKNYELPREAVLGIIDFTVICKNVVIDRKYTKLPRYPSVNRDVAVVLDSSIEAAGVEKAIRQAGGDNLESLVLFDVYKGEKIGPDNKSLAYSLTWRDKDKTLSDDDISLPMDRILKKLKDEFGAELRQV
jgi:phenylalanyl-tRNA synthetase beta chain